MARSSDSVSIGNGPDFAMRLGADELSHVFTFLVNRPRGSKTSLVPSGVSSDKSLATAVEKLKQMLAPYGWSRSIHIDWQLLESFTGKFRGNEYEISLSYRFHERLELAQRNELAGDIMGLFE